MAIFPVSFKPPLSQNNGQAGREGTPHSPLLPERLEKPSNIIKGRNISNPPSTNSLQSWTSVCKQEMHFDDKNKVTQHILMLTLYCS